MNDPTREDSLIGLFAAAASYGIRPILPSISGHSCQGFVLPVETDNGPKSSDYATKREWLYAVLRAVAEDTANIGTEDD